MKFSDLTEDQWEYIKCFLPPQPRVGRKRAEDRKTIIVLNIVNLTYHTRIWVSTFVP